MITKNTQDDNVEKNTQNYYEGGNFFYSISKWTDGYNELRMMMVMSLFVLEACLAQCNYVSPHRCDEVEEEHMQKLNLLVFKSECSRGRTADWSFVGGYCIKLDASRPKHAPF